MLYPEDYVREDGTMPCSDVRRWFLEKGMLLHHCIDDRIYMVNFHDGVLGNGYCNVPAPQEIVDIYWLSKPILGNLCVRLHDDYWKKEPLGDVARQTQEAQQAAIDMDRNKNGRK